MFTDAFKNAGKKLSKAEWSSLHMAFKADPAALTEGRFPCLTPPMANQHALHLVERDLLCATGWLRLDLCGFECPRTSRWAVSPYRCSLIEITALHIRI